MEGFAKQYSRASFALMAGLALVFGALVVWPFVPALLWASVLSILLYPVYRQWKGWLGTKRWFNEDRAATTASLFTTLAALVIVFIPFLMIGGGIYGQIQNIAHEIAGRNGGQTESVSFDSVLKYADDAIRPIAVQIGARDFSLVEYVKENRETIVQNIRQPAARAAGQAATTVLTLVIALLTTFFMLRDGERLREPVVELIPLPREKTEDILARIADTVRAVFVGTVLVAIIQGAIMGFTYWWVGVPNALLLGVFSVLLCIIPLLGAPVLYLPIGLFFLAQGDIPAALKVLLMGGLVVSQIDNVLKPFFIGGRANLHPMAVFFSILGGVLFIGPIGVMAGPMLLTLILALTEIVREKNRLAGAT